jgi:uncharacterized protein (DUF1778 family)
MGSPNGCRPGVDGFNAPVFLLFEETIVEKTVAASNRKPRQARLVARLSTEDKAIIRRAADMNGQTLGDFVVSSAFAAAEELIQKREVIVLSERDSIAFVEAILSSKGPNDALRKAFERHRELIGPQPPD